MPGTFFKDPQKIGEYISALANGAALCGRPHGFLVWGIQNDDHAIVGTGFKPESEKKGGEELENWLLRSLKPRIDFRFHHVEIDWKHVVVLEIDRASQVPVSFNGAEWIRVGSYKKRLRDYPEKERELWRIFDRVPFEAEIASEKVTAGDVLQGLDYPAFFDLNETALPESRDSILDALKADRLISPCEAGGFNITNLGAMLYAKRIDDFPSLSRKAIRVIQYKGRDRVETVREQLGTKGYANGFEGLLSFINGLLPSNEVLELALRKTVPMFPTIAVRELVANALIHQDFSVTGSGPMVEIFEDRIEITNPGEPLVSADRFLDCPPTSRNESLASLMRRIGVCEERGSGIDKVVSQVELHQLPAPLFEVPPGFTKAVLFAHRPLTEMERDDRIRACYLHACLKFVRREYLTNSSLRQRFGVEDKNKATVSRYIKEALVAKVIVPYDENAGNKFMKYQPWWASVGS